MNKFSASERVALANEVLISIAGRGFVSKRHRQVGDSVFMDSIPVEFFSLEDED